MTEKRSTDEELEQQDGEALPDREAMSVTDPDPELTLDPPKQSREPGFPPPRD